MTAADLLARLGFPGAGVLDGAVVDGAVAATSGAELAVEDPATLETLATVREATGADVDDAVRSAARAYDGWRGLPGRERGRLLTAVSAVIRDAAAQSGLGREKGLAAIEGYTQLKTVIVSDPPGGHGGEATRS